jgi:RNA polymerase sigma-70 factor (ECF subfamily)
MLRSRRTRREAPLGPHLPDPVVSPEEGSDPEHEALLGDSVGLALFVVLDTLSPAERIAFVLHDVFGVPFDEIAAIVDRSPVATRQLASRARRRIRGAPVPDPDIKAQRAVVEAFVAAARRGDFEGLIAVLDPDIVLRSDGGTARPGLARIIRGAEAVAAGALRFSRFYESATPVLVNGTAGMVAWTPKGQPFAVISFTVQNRKIVSMETLADPDRMRALDLTIVVY